MEPLLDIFFTGSTNPRECIMIGGVRGTEHAVFLSFQTESIPMAETVTRVFRNNGPEPVATLYWTMAYHAGTVTVGADRFHMSQLMQAEPDDRRAFRAPNGRQFYWHRLPEQPTAYNLYRIGSDQQSHNVAQFWVEARSTSIGPCHALMSTALRDETEILYAAVSLCVNRWIDSWQGL